MPSYKTYIMKNIIIYDNVGAVLYDKDLLMWGPGLFEWNTPYRGRLHRREEI